jgi:serine/threonine protein kinase
MGVVFAATEPNLDREVALKVLSTDLAHDPDFRGRFTQEAKALAALDSANVVHVYSHGEESGQLYIATQLVPDGDLHKLLAKGGALEVDQALDLVAQVAAGVADAHDAGLIHRDIKPANVLIRRRGSELRAYVTDFGLARSASQHTMSGLMVGTPSYMAPELHEGRPATISSDIYALGCLLWATLSGKAPYQGTTEFEIIRKHMTDPIPSFEGNDRLARALNRTLNLSLAKHPDRRYRNARDLRADLLKAVPLARERSGRPDTKSHELPQTRLPGQHSPRPAQLPDHPAIPSQPSNPSPVPSRPTPSQSYPGPATPSYSTPQYSQQSYFQNSPPPAAPARQKSMLPLLTGIVGVLVVVVAGVLIWALMQGGDGGGGGGGGGDDPTTSLSREERAAAAVSEGLQDNDDNMQEELADCIGEKWVAKSGVDDIVEAGYLDEELTTYNKDPKGDDSKILATSLDQIAVIGTCSKS